MLPFRGNVETIAVTVRWYIVLFLLITDIFSHLTQTVNRTFKFRWALRLTNITRPPAPFTSFSTEGAPFFLNSRTDCRLECGKIHIYVCAVHTLKIKKHFISRMRAHDFRPKALCIWISKVVKEDFRDKMWTLQWTHHGEKIYGNRFSETERERNRNFTYD